MKLLALEDLVNQTEEQIFAHLVNEWSAPDDISKTHTLLVAYESVGDYGCDSAGWYLLREKKSRALFEVSGSHCSCYGFEGQFSLEPTSKEYLRSERFSISCGGYDNCADSNRKAIKDWLKSNRL